MAVDTAKKRASLLGIVTPDGTIDQADRQTLAGLYGGILIVAAAVADAAVAGTVSLTRAITATVGLERAAAGVVAIDRTVTGRVDLL